MMVKIYSVLIVLTLNIAAVTCIPSKQADKNDDRETKDKIIALALVVFFGGVGGFLLQLIQGLNLGCIKVKPLCTCITCPALVGMIVFGCIARNGFGDYVMDNYPDYWADWIRQVCLSIILMRGGLQLSFEGIGTTVGLLTLCPQLFEASAVAVMSHYMFDMPWTVAYANGFCIGAVSPAVLLQSVMRLISLNRGTKKGIPSIMLIASSFDDIVAITVFSVFISISFDEVQSTAGGADIKTMVGMNVFYFVIGILFGAIAGFSMTIFNKCTCNLPRLKMWMKFLITLSLAIFLPFATHYTKFEESKYIGIIFFGYFSYRVWGDEKPDMELANFWIICQPFLFSSVGASIIIKNIQFEVFGKAILILVVGVLMRLIGTFLVTAGQGFTVKERGFFAFSWIPKATVQAAIGGIVLDTARNLSGIDKTVRESYIQYGNIVLSMAVLSIILTAPTGAILINTLGERWLSDDSIKIIDVDKDDQNQADTERQLNGDLRKPSIAMTSENERTPSVLKNTEGSFENGDNKIEKIGKNGNQLDKQIELVERNSTDLNQQQVNSQETINGHGNHVNGNSKLVKVSQQNQQREAVVVKTEGDYVKIDNVQDLVYQRHLEKQMQNGNANQ